jgi:hypothetical protein
MKQSRTAGSGKVQNVQDEVVLARNYHPNKGYQANYHTSQKAKNQSFKGDNTDLRTNDPYISGYGNSEGHPAILTPGSSQEMVEPHTFMQSPTDQIGASKSFKDNLEMLSQ